MLFFLGEILKEKKNNKGLELENRNLMQAHTSSNEHFPSFQLQDENKQSNDGLISFIENDLVLNFLNDDTHNK